MVAAAAKIIINSISLPLQALPRSQKFYFFKKKERILISHFFTNTDKAPSEATFRGTEFLSYDLGEPIVSAQDSVSLYFRTRQSNALLFYTGKLPGSKVEPLSKIFTST